jgi:2-polyprenyl-3-methyl-5-hydroxy-6-metoxy-1,4-benzoquinol methylase
MSDQRRIFGTAQVDRDHYFGEKYLGVSRFTSLHSQFHLCMRGDPCDTYLEIGPGPGLLVGLLKHFGRNITTVDIAKDLNPDYIAALPSLPFEDNSFDIVCAFEVLEHIPKDMLPLCIREAKRLARKRILISLPNQCNIYDKSVSFRIAVGNLIESLIQKNTIGRLAMTESQSIQLSMHSKTPAFKILRPF